MAKCSFCERDMTETDSCLGERTIKYADGLELPVVPFMDDDFEVCPDCKVLRGMPHHPGCDQEVCPRCGEQYLRCNCREMEPVTEIQQIFKADPRLVDLEKRIVNAAGDSAHKLWYGNGEPGQSGFKREMSRLVGRMAENPELRSQEVYDMTYAHLYSLLTRHTPGNNPIQK